MHGVYRLHHRYVVVILLAFLSAVTTKGEMLPGSPTPGTVAAQEAPVDGRGPRWQYRNLFPYRMQFEQLSVEQGLSNASIYAILQDGEGFMWFGTEDGLNKYDGHTFTVYKRDPDDPHSISNNAILDLHEDRTGRLWVATFGGGLERFDRRTERFIHYRHDPDNPDSVSSDYLVRIYEDARGTLWITSEGGGLNRFDPETETFTHYRHDPDDPASISHDIVTRVLEDSRGDLWVGTDGAGLNRMDRETGTFTHYRYDAEDAASIGNDIIWSIVEDRDGELWIGTFGGGISRYDRERDQFIRYQHDPEDPASLSSNNVRLLYEDSESILWIGTVDAGLDRLDRDREQFHHIPPMPGDQKQLQSEAVWSLYEDRSGVLWVGTLGAGLHKHARGQERFVHVPADPEDPQALQDGGIKAYFEDSAGNLWLATSGGGLDRFDPLSGATAHYHNDPQEPASLSNDLTGPMTIDAAGTLWVGTFGTGVSGLDLTDEANLDPETARFVHIQEDATSPGNLHDIIWSLHADRSDTLWVGTQTGLDGYRLGTDEVLRYRHDPEDEGSLSNNVIRAILEDSKEQIWVGTDVGLNRLDRESGRFARYSHDPGVSNSLSNNVVFAIHEDGDGVLWIGTWGGGLNRFDPEAEDFSHYTEKDGLPNDTVFSIAGDEVGNLWLSTGRGLSRFDPESETFTNFDSGDGLYGTATGELFMSQTGELLVSDGSGFTIVKPDNVDAPSSPPPVVLTGLFQGGEEIEIGKVAEGAATVTLRWPQNFFEFEYAALDYVRPEKNQYAYMLEGFDAAWNDMGTHAFGRYTNLPGGRYTLRIRGSNSDGVWNEQGMVLAVTVVPPFWATWWFRLLVGVMVVGGAAAAYTWRLRNLSQQQRRLEAEVASRTREVGALYAIAAEASRSVDLQDILSTSLEKTLKVMEADAGGVYLRSRDETLGIAAHRGFGGALLAAIDNLKVGEGFNGRVVESGQALVVHDLAADPRLTRHAAAEAGFRTLAAVPLVAKGQISGSLFLATRRERAFFPEDLELLTSIGRQLGGAVAHARLFSEEQRRAEQFRLINEASQRITSVLALGELLQEIAVLIHDTFHYYGVGIGLIEGDELIFRTGVGSFWNEIPPNQPLRLKVGEEGINGWVAEKGEALNVPDVSRDRRTYFVPQPGGTLSELSVPMKSKGVVIGVIGVQSNHLHAFDESDEAVLQSLANQAAVAIENARLFAAEQRRAEQFQVINEVGHRITAILDIDNLLEEVVRLIRRTFGYYHVAIGLIEGDEVVYHVGAGELWDDPTFDFRPARLKVGRQGLSGWVADRGEPVLVPDVKRDPRYVWMEGSQTRSELIVPIEIQGKTVGVLDVQSNRLNAFDETDLVVLQALAHQAGTAIENARLYAQARQLAVMEERSRLARDLHDAVTQSLYSLTLHAEAGRRMMSNHDLPEIQSNQDRIGDISQQALQEMRLLVYQLRPPELQVLGLVGALEQRLDVVERRAGIEARLQVEGAATLSHELEEHLYRIAQEALNNALKHAQAAAVTVLIDFAPERVSITVSDDGRGFEPLAVGEKGGLGLTNMGERARKIGGRLTVQAAPGRGTTVSVDVPLPAARLMTSQRQVTAPSPEEDSQ